MDDLTVFSRDRSLTLTVRDDGKVTVRVAARSKHIGTVLSVAHEEAIRRWLNERHDARA